MTVTFSSKTLSPTESERVFEVLRSKSSPVLLYCWEEWPDLSKRDNVLWPKLPNESFWLPSDDEDIVLIDTVRNCLAIGGIAGRLAHMIAVAISITAQYMYWTRLSTPAVHSAFIENSAVLTRRIIVAIKLKNDRRYITIKPTAAKTN